ncbi:MAG: heme ABC transporter ATP-binding protein [Candidatus Poribacteria bacterium]|nr:heme ABC transporter ATP-binding protein [Candidatus Poribacteria bacterium]MDE0505102.1 heme ABC transporter ATP-binding protein [Candidatus Poribacteria bacterium]
MVELEQVGYRTGQKWVVRDINLKVEPRQFWMIVGPNGAGKSTLLRLISGELTPQMGRIRLFGRDISSYSAQQMARLRAYLQQKREVNFPFRALEIVLLGRYPHLNGSKETADDWAIARKCMEQVEADAFTERLYTTLSGGEASRVDLARILAQEPRLFLSDEPTNHLDPRHQVQTLDLCRSIARSGKSVIAAIHDLNLASMYADKVLILRDGNAVTAGSPETVFTPEQLESVYDLPFETLHSSSGRTVITPLAPTPQ